MTTARSCPKCGAALGAFAAEGCCSACLLEAALLPDVEARADAPPATASFGDYEVLREIARGGMGVVYLARQRSLGRTVALKMILGGRLAGEADVARFRAEARAAAALQHPHIVAIHEVGEAHGQPFFSMDYVPGRSLAEVLQDGPMPSARAAALLRSVAQAVHYAHQRGLLHRDIKPANILLDEHGQPRVTDFGLAKQFSTSEPGLAASKPGESGIRNAELTLTGQMLGSPNFMPPEQAAGKHRELTPAADIYSLGALLYHCLTGRPPFLADSVPETLRLVAETEPVAPRLLHPSIPRDLETICLKCLAKEPSRRYATARELADELGRFLHDEPIRARPAGRVEKAWRWCRRHPALAAVSVLAGLLVIAVITITTAAVIRLERANQDGQEKLWQSYLAQARANRWSGRPGRRFGTLDVIQKAAAIRPSIELRNEAIAAMALPDVRSIRTLESGTNAATFSPDTGLYFQQAPDGRFHFRQTSDARAVFIWQPPPGSWSVLNQRWSRDNRYCAIALTKDSASHFEVIHLPERRSVLSVTNYWARTFDFAPDGRMVMVGRTNNVRPTELQLLQLPSGTVLRREPISPLPYETAFSPDGTRLAISFVESHIIRILDTETGQPLRTLPTGNASIHGIDWNHKGTKLAAANGLGYACVWDLERTGDLPLKLPHGGVVTGVSFDATGEWLASFGWNDLAKIWHLPTGRNRLELDAIVSPAYSTKEWRLSYRSAPHKLELAEFEPAKEYLEMSLPSMKSKARHASFHPDDRLLAVPDGEGTLLWDAVNRCELARLPGREANAAWFHPAGDWLVVLTRRLLQVWRIKLESAQPTTRRFTLEQQTKLYDTSGPLTGDAAGRFVAFVNDGWAEVVELATGTKVLPRERQKVTEDAFSTALMSPDGRWCLATTWLERETFAIPMDSAVPVRRVPGVGVSTLAFSQDGRLLLKGSDRDYAGMDGGTFAELWRFSRTSKGRSKARLAVSAPARLGAVTETKETVRLFSLDDGSELATLAAADPAVIHSFALASDGSRLAVLTVQGLVVWDLRAIRRQLAAINLDWDLPPLPPAPATNAPLAIVVAAPEQEPGAPAEETYPPRDPACTSRHIDLSAHYNATLTSSWLNPRWEQNHLPVPRGLHSLDGIPFDLRGLVQLSGTELDLSNRFPAEVTGIPVGLKTPALHFLHATAWQPPDGTEVASYVLRYADGLELRVPLVNARNIRVWWRTPKDAVSLHPGATVAWQGDSPYSKARGWSATLYRFRLENPRPDVVITSLDFVSAGTQAAPFLLAITAE